MKHTWSIPRPAVVPLSGAILTLVAAAFAVNFPSSPLVVAMLMATVLRVATGFLYWILRERALDEGCLRENLTHIGWERRFVGCSSALDASNRLLETEPNHRKTRLVEWQQTLSEFKTLRSPLIRPSNKSNHDDTGLWSQNNVYSRDHSDAECSHGISPQCIAEMYPNTASAHQIRE